MYTTWSKGVHMDVKFTVVSIRETYDALTKVIGHNITHSLVDSRYNAPDIVVHFKAFQLSVTVTHRTTPRASLTVHLQICLQIKTLWRNQMTQPQSFLSLWQYPLQYSLCDEDIGYTHVYVHAKFFSCLVQFNDTCTNLCMWIATIMYTPLEYFLKCSMFPWMVLTCMCLHSAPRAGSEILLNVTGHLRLTLTPVCCTLSSELLANQRLTVCVWGGGVGGRKRGLRVQERGRREKGRGTIDT